MTAPSASQTATAPAVPDVDEEKGDVFKQIYQWVVSLAAQSWLISMIVHMAMFIVMALVLGTIHVVATTGDMREFAAVEEVPVDLPEVTHFEVGYTPPDPTERTTETLTLTEAPSVEAQFNDNSPVFQEAGGGVTAPESSFGGLGGFNTIASGMGPVVKGPGGVDGGGGFGKNFGKGGAGEGFGTRGSGMREKMLGTGGTKQSERAVAAALNWLARHQNADGSWSLNHVHRCKSAACPGPGDVKSDSAATAMALLPFLAAGQTQQTKGPYQKNIAAGIAWLMHNQKRDGDLSAGGPQMYSHGLATIAMCEAYGMTQDSRLGQTAQGAINFIESGQNREGGWRYTHGSNDSDTSVFGWQVMALKSGQMAKLQVNPAALDGCKNYLKLASSGRYREQFGYTPGAGGTVTMTSVGLLTSQYLGANKNDPVVRGGVEFLMQNKPVATDHNVYYWYYATQAMHNVPGKEWDEWNRTMRRILIETQDKTGCAAGSWDPDRPSPDAWGRSGGRLMVTSLSALTLEVYYRYLPLYKLDGVKEDLNKLPVAE